MNINLAIGFESHLKKKAEALESKRGRESAAHKFHMDIVILGLVSVVGTVLFSFICLQAAMLHVENLTYGVADSSPFVYACVCVILVVICVITLWRIPTRLRFYNQRYKNKATNQVSLRASPAASFKRWINIQTRRSKNGRDHI